MNHLLDHIVVSLGMRSQLVPTKLFLSSYFYLVNGYRINWKQPQSFNEKLCWLKVYNRQPLYTKLVDKYEVKSYVANKVGSQYVVPNFGVYDRWDNIDFTKLPDQFVIKCTHDSGGAFICMRKSQFDYHTTKEKIEENLKQNHWLGNREWPYKNVKPRIIVDKLLDDHTGKELRDYKFWCFNGKPVYMYCTIKGENIYENFYDMDFNPVDINHGFPRHVPEFEKPSQFEVMKELATNLSNGIPFVRVDFFQVEEKVYFGEFTFFDWGGLQPFVGDWDKKLGSLLSLESVRKNF